MNTTANSFIKRHDRGYQLFIVAENNGNEYVIGGNSTIVCEITENFNNYDVDTNNRTIIVGNHKFKCEQKLFEDIVNTVQHQSVLDFLGYVEDAAGNSEFAEYLTKKIGQGLLNS
jgi:hypothetical protein